MTKLHASLLIFTAALASSYTSADKVLVLGNAPSQLLHETRPSSTFSVSGLAELALNSLGVATGRVSSRVSPIESPLQADLFTHTEAYALLLVDGASASALDTIDAALAASPAYHKTFPTQSASVKVPMAVAQEFQAKYPSSVRCAGSAAFCASVEAWTPSGSAALVQEVLSAYNFLQIEEQEDVAFAKELAQVKQLMAALKEDADRKALYVVGLSTPKLEGQEKQQQAAQAVAASVTEFLAELVKTRAVVGAQVMTGNLPASVQDVAALSRRTRNRRLVSGLTDEEEEESDSDEDSNLEDSESEDSDSDEGEEVDEVDLAAASGSTWEDAGNATTKTNSTASPVSMPDIAEFQIVLWTSVLLGAILLMAILAMCNMDTGRDSLLYAKFIADNTERELARLAQRRANVRAKIGITSATMEQQLDAATQEKLVDLFDNEAIWDADDTDGYIVQLFQGLEASGADLITLKDQGCNSLLHMTALWNRPKIMEELIRRGALLNEKNKNGHTPLDLAMHWGHFDIGQQLQHYGGKHTCEKERDTAISQRDLVQKQLKNCESELDHAVEAHKRAKQEREQLRIERDRLVIQRAQVVDECTELGKQVEEFRSAVTSTTKERDALQIQAAQLKNELVCEQTARNNAVHSWQMAEKIIVELQQMQEECREREEEALRLRNEAIQDRDVARERAHEAQLDQGIAKQNQLDAERDRDKAVDRLLQGEAEIAHDKEKWQKWIAKAELERQKFVAALVTYLAANLKHLRIQAQVQEKMIERKGELIQRFTHHRQEKAKRQNPVRFRELSVRPIL
ncbi:hypothetical protein BBJ29_000294 [Phytophthora kernoviae]|uniref:Uncharacterized protein n=1 Tax=Phytophthora kernoviae TaxID=325452 RepID=A0A421FNQ9_9STRA|nr:hypothetical protein BBJ29_000294 [Phytophthora kernoviae]